MKRGLLVSVVIAVALSSGALLAVDAPAGAQSTTTAGGKPIKVAYIYADLSKLKGTGFVVDVGNPEAQVTAFVDALNARGGINGRKVELSTHSYDVLASDVLAVQRAACLSATEDDKVMVVLSQVIFDDPILCVTKQHKTPLIVQTGTSTELIKRSEGRLFTTNLSWADDLRAGAQTFGKSLKGKTVGIIHLDESGLAADVETGLVKPLAKQGVQVKERVVVPNSSTDEMTAAIPAAIERLRTAGVDALFLAVNSYAASIFLTQAEQAGYHPTYYATDLDEVSTNLVPGLSPKGAMTGAHGVTWRNTGAAETGESPLPFDEACKQTYEKETGKKVPAFGSDEYGAVAGTCALVKLFELAATKAGSNLSGATFVKALAGLKDFELGGGAKGSYGPKRYDVPDAIRELKIKESCTGPSSEGKSCWVPVGKVIPFALIGTLMSVRPDNEQRDPAALAAVVLEQEATRQASAAAPDRIVLPDDLLPGVGLEPMGLAAAVRSGGVGMLVVLSLIVVVEWLDRTALAVLAPDIQSSLGVSDAVIGVIGGAFGVLFVLGALPFGALADRAPRTKVASFATAAWSAVVFATGLVTSAVWLFVARVASGLAQSNSLPVHNSLLADAYPLQARGRIFGLYNLATPIGLVLAPVAVGGIAALAGGDEGWRWAFFATAILALVLAVIVGLLREPKRGANEQELVLGETLGEQADELPIPMATAFARLQKIRTFYVLLVGVGALGFALFSIPLFFNLFLEHEYGLGAFDRGLVNAATYLPALVVIPIVAISNDRLFRQSPPRSLVLAGGLIAAFGVILAAGLYMPGLVGLIIVFGIGTALSQAAFAVLTPVVASVLPFRLRSQGYAMFGVYIFLFGAFFGSVLAGVLSDSLGERLAMTILVIPSTLIGGTIIATGARHVREDISLVVEELLEERGERARLAATDATAPMLQIRNLDASYGTVQVLFDVALDVHHGEVLALLGTNGAGKSTLLRVVSGLLMPHRGVVRLDSRTITYADAVTRVDLGIVQVPGGKAIFPSLTVQENLRAAASSVERRSVRARVDRAFDMFPTLRAMADRPAASLSGGQQQMLALAKALVLEPRLLLIDELSLGLAPLVVQELLGVVDELKAQGMTMVIVEQSLNVALELADRAVFMEKGEVRFEGPAEELRDRHDLVRAVFLGAEGG